MEFTFLWEDTTDETLVNKCIHEESKGGDVFENGWGQR